MSNYDELKKEIELSKKLLKKSNRRLSIAYHALQGMCLLYAALVLTAVLLEVCQ